MADSSTPTGLVPRRGVRPWLRRRLGGYSPLLRWYKRLRPQWAWERLNPSGKATARFVSEHGLTVRYGPFAGMVYPADAVGRVAVLPSKLLGTYEPELGPHVQAVGANADVFVDLGSGDGYYCVGFGRLFPQATVIGYEMDDGERALAARLALLNGVSVEFRGIADEATLNSLPAGRLLLMADIEGAEYELLDPDRFPRLREASIIVEVHPIPHPDIVDVLHARFAATHSITDVAGRPKSIALPELDGWDRGLASMAVSEGRTGYGQWLILTPI